LLLFVCSLSVPLYSQLDHGADGGWSASRPDSHAPLGVMGDHVHGRGEWMLSYRFMPMAMRGNVDGTNGVALQQIFDQGYMVAPRRMDMSMHMFGLMFAPSSRLTLMGMVNYVDMSMDLRTKMGVDFSTESSGLGDTRLSGLILLGRWGHSQLHANLGVSLPTGATDQSGDTPMATGARLPYPMQLGSGTFDVLPGLTLVGQDKSLSWGMQAAGTLRLGENGQDYTLGNRFLFNAWGARMWNGWWSSSLRLGFEKWGNIDGADPKLNPMMVPTAQPNLRVGNRLDLGVGTNLYIRSGALKGHRLAVEFGLPLYQSLEGPQLKTRWSGTLGWQKAF
jgi:hypothetical protein